MNEVTTRNNNLPATSNVANPFATAAVGARGNTIYMKFKGSTGFSTGVDEDDVESGTRFAADIINSGWTWTFWWENEVLETFTDLIIDNPRGFEKRPHWLPESYEDDMSLPEIEKRQDDRDDDNNDGWTVQAVLNLRSFEGEALEYTLKLNAGVALSAFQGLLQSFGRQYTKMGEKIPVVELGTKTYTSKIKKVGKKKAPTFKIVAWMEEEELLNSVGEDPSDYEAQDTPEVAPAPAEPPRRGARGRTGFGS